MSLARLKKYDPQLHFKRARAGQSMLGSSFVNVIFEEGTDLYWARSRVLEYLSTATAKLPEEAPRPFVYFPFTQHQRSRMSLLVESEEATYNWQPHDALLQQDRRTRHAAR